MDPTVMNTTDLWSMTDYKTDSSGNMDLLLLCAIVERVWNGDIRSGQIRRKDVENVHNRLHQEKPENYGGEDQANTTMV